MQMILDFIFHFYYFAIRNLLQIIFRSTLIKVWPRNSYVFKDLTWRSDLDLTLLIDISRQEQKKFDQRLRFWQKFSHGEWNVYFLPRLPLVINSINPYELQRDPYLKAWFKNHQLAAQSTTDAAVFLMKHLAIDWQNLKTTPLRRRKKWRRHLQQVGKSLDLQQNFIPQIQFVISQLLELSNDEATILWQEHEEFWNQNQRQLLPSQVQYWQDRPWLWTFQVAQFPFLGADQVHWTEIQKKIILAETRWEIFAALTQSWKNKGFSEHLTRHENFILQVFDPSQSPECKSLLNDLRAAQLFLKD